MKNAHVIGAGDKSLGVFRCTLDLRPGTVERIDASYFADLFIVKLYSKHRDYEWLSVSSNATRETHAISS